ncbi:MAG: hypothetical protein EBX50_07195 [Chitinophagia bacterium]|nr:hypothetical protein [Chitinophagia bacterium]
MLIRLALIMIVMAGICKQTFSQSIAGKTKLSVKIEPMVGEKKWLIDSTYVNALGEPFSIDKCLFYLSNFEWKSTSGKWSKIPNSYYLVNIADSSSLQIQLPLQTLAIKGLRFMIVPYQLQPIQFVMCPENLRNKLQTIINFSFASSNHNETISPTHNHDRYCTFRHRLGSCR